MKNLQSYEEWLNESSHEFSIDSEYEGKTVTLDYDQIEASLEDTLKVANNEKDFIAKITYELTDSTSKLKPKDVKKLSKWYKANESVNEGKNSFKFDGDINQLEDMLSNDDHNLEGGDEDKDTYYIVDKKKNTVGVISWDGKTVTLMDVPKGVFVNESCGKKHGDDDETNEGKDFEPHMMYCPKSGKEYKAETQEDHEKFSKLGYVHEKPKMNED